MKLDKKDQLEIVENAISWVVVLAMFIYGGGKIIQFEGATEIKKTLPEMNGMEMMWAFYGFSKPYALTLGFFEVLGGILILIRKTRIFGCLLVSAILVNVILQDIYFDIPLGALRAALLYQGLIVIILVLNKGKIIHGIRALLTLPKRDPSNLKFLIKLGIAFLLFVVLRIAEFFFTMKM